MEKPDGYDTETETAQPLSLFKAHRDELRALLFQLRNDDAIYAGTQITMRPGQAVHDRIMLLQRVLIVLIESGFRP